MGLSLQYQRLIEAFGALRKPHGRNEKWCTAITQQIVFTHDGFAMRLPATWWRSVSQEGERRKKMEAMFQIPRRTNAYQSWRSTGRDRRRGSGRVSDRCDSCQRASGAQSLWPERPPYLDVTDDQKAVIQRGLAQIKEMG